MGDLHLRLVREAVDESVAAKRGFFDEAAGRVVEAALAVAAAVRAGGKVLFFGNGGSAADAQHLATELVVRMERDRPALAAIALTTDSSTLTATANDMGFERVFARQIEALGRPGDVAVAISTSGRSPNVLAGLAAAEAGGLLTIGLLGRDGGPALARCRHALVVPGRSTQRIQEVHILLGHLLAEIVEAELCPRGEP